jgi:hypothetical protein
MMNSAVPLNSIVGRSVPIEQTQQSPPKHARFRFGNSPKYLYQEAIIDGKALLSRRCTHRDGRPKVPGETRHFPNRHCAGKTVR